MGFVNILFNTSKSNSRSKESLKLGARSNNLGILHFCNGVYFFCFDFINSSKQDVGIMTQASMKNSSLGTFFFTFALIFRFSYVSWVAFFMYLSCVNRNLETSLGCIYFLPRGIFQVAKVLVQVGLQ